MALTVAAIYLGLIFREDGSIGPDALVIFALIAGPGVLWLVAGRSPDPDRALAMRSIAAGMLLSVAVLAIFSVGLPLLIAAIAFVIGAVRGARVASRRSRSRAVVWGAAAAVLPWVVLFF